MVEPLSGLSKSTRAALRYRPAQSSHERGQAPTGGTAWCRPPCRSASTATPPFRHRALRSRERSRCPNISPRWQAAGLELAGGQAWVSWLHRLL